MVIHCGKVIMYEEEDRNESTQVSLREITSQNIKAVLGLSVTKEQKKVYPRSNAYSIAEGHYPVDDDPVWMRAIYAGEVPVGFLMTSEAPDRGEYFLWRLMIDAKHQRKGYGSRAVKLLIARIRASPNAKVLMVSHLMDDNNADSFYQRLGFEYTDELRHGRDHVMTGGNLIIKTSR
jgi:diamine N-acetyltransferase